MLFGEIGIFWGQLGLCPYQFRWSSAAKVVRLAGVGGESGGAPRAGKQGGASREGGRSKRRDETKVRGRIVASCPWKPLDDLADRIERERERERMRENETPRWTGVALACSQPRSTGYSGRVAIVPLLSLSSVSRECDADGDQWSSKAEEICIWLLMWFQV